MIFKEFNAYKHSKHNASSKAKTDVSKVLCAHGYTPIYQPSKHRNIRILQQLWAIAFLPKDTILFVQYPSHSPQIYNLLAKKNGIKKIALLHDVQSLRGLMDVDKEMSCLNNFDVIISHNAEMSGWLKAKGITVPIYDLQIFDYLLNDGISVNNQFDKNTIFFAGNLQKSKFLTQLSELSNLHFNIYGAPFGGIDSISQQPNVNYEGSFSPEELIANIKGGWGLIWDGDSTETCTGIVGEYMRYNNPHKVSMCLVSERPVIIWKESAMAPYIESKGLGICVNSLSEVYEKIQKIDDKEYNRMLENVKKEKNRLVQGMNLIEALNFGETLLGVTTNM